MMIDPVAPVASRISRRLPTTRTVLPVGIAIDCPAITQASGVSGIEVYAVHSIEFVVSIVWVVNVTGPWGGSTQTLTYVPAQIGGTLPSRLPPSMIRGSL